jgi:hypothetical protein
MEINWLANLYKFVNTLYRQHRLGLISLTSSAMTIELGEARAIIIAGALAYSSLCFRET